MEILIKSSWSWTIATLDKQCRGLFSSETIQMSFSTVDMSKKMTIDHTCFFSILLHGQLVPACHEQKIDIHFSFFPSSSIDLNSREGSRVHITLKRKSTFCHEEATTRHISWRYAKILSSSVNEISTKIPSETTVPYKLKTSKSPSKLMKTDSEIQDFIKRQKNEVCMYPRDLLFFETAFGIYSVEKSSRSHRRERVQFVTSSEINV